MINNGYSNISDLNISNIMVQKRDFIFHAILRNTVIP